MAINSGTLAEIKRISQSDLILMDKVIEDRLSNRSSLVNDITFHIIKSGGKRLRPIITILSSKLYGYSGQRHINLAAAVEFIHTATLLHDDVIDHSEMRRGKPTANNCWDNKSCILVGDFLFSQAFLLMSEDQDLEVLSTLSRASSIIAEGEVNQLASISNLDLSSEQYINIITAKTAELFAAAAKVGAIVANKDTLVRDNMFNFGLDLGIAFQIIDDILDYTANENFLGKSVGDDFREKKVTLPIIFAYNESNETEKKFWQQTFGQNQQNPYDFETAIEIIDKYQVIAKCLIVAEKYIEKAKDSIEHAPDNEIKFALEKLLNFSLKREF